MADRETCVAKLAEILGSISMVNGFGVDLGSPISRNLHTIDEMNDTEFDTLIVEDNGDGEKERVERMSGDLVKVVFSVPVIGYVRKGASDASVTTAINRLNKAVSKAVGQRTVQQIDGVWLLVKALPLLGRSGSENGDYGWFIRPIEMHYQARLDSGF